VQAPLHSMHMALPQKSNHSAGVRRLDDMQKDSAANESDDGEPIEAAAPRPARLGLGAKFIPHSAALNTRDLGAEGWYRALHMLLALFRRVR
jgi:hypothetical protein